MNLKFRLEYLSIQPQQKLYFPKWEINNNKKKLGKKRATKILNLTKEKDFLLTNLRKVHLLTGDHVGR